MTDPIWIALHNVLHAPLMLLGLALLGWWGQRRGHAWGSAVLWFAAGCGFHSLIDIFTHYDDGPVLFFPLDWRYRWPAPVSYWDPAHGGREFTVFELVLDGLILIYFAVKFTVGRLRPVRPAP